MHIGPICLLKFLVKHHIFITLNTLEESLILLGVSKKRNTFDLEYLKDGSIKLIVLLVCCSVSIMFVFTENIKGYYLNHIGQNMCETSLYYG